MSELKIGANKGFLSLVILGFLGLIFICDQTKVYNLILYSKPSIPFLFNPTYYQGDELN